MLLKVSETPSLNVSPAPSFAALPPAEPPGPDSEHAAAPATSTTATTAPAIRRAMLTRINPFDPIGVEAGP
ncbi:hypothetical protein GCM10022220_25740 [Actinocatenispora rupis]|uniref:Uncharacterized protein n=1 Tax=Actinocatenispora rupis TaxID=519421 RepID=A0A8J3J427_9ACTN|nr:hypothetical protein Aru02nite_21400 [Actinocatenispora rupis]